MSNAVKPYGLVQGHCILKGVYAILVVTLVLVYLQSFANSDKNEKVYTAAQFLAPSSVSRNMCYTTPSDYTNSWRREPFAEKLQQYDFSRTDETRLRANMIFDLATEMFDFLGAPWIALAGTAIGTLRHASIIPFDADMDVGLFLDDLMAVMALLIRHRPPPTPFETERSHHEDLWETYGDVLEQVGRDQDARWKDDPHAQKQISRFRKNIFMGSFLRSHIKLVGTEGESLDIDLFPLYWIKNHTAVWIPGNDLVVNVQDFFPLHIRPFNHGYTLMVRKQGIVGSRTVGFDSEVNSIFDRCGPYACEEFQKYFPCVTQRRHIPLWQRLNLLKNGFGNATPQLQIGTTKVTLGDLKRRNEKFLLRFNLTLRAIEEDKDVRINGWNKKFRVSFVEHNIVDPHYQSTIEEAETDRIPVLIDSLNPYVPWYEETVSVGPKIICQYIIKGGDYDTSQVVKVKSISSSK